MDLKKLNILKEKLMTTEDFHQPWNYFFDHFGENPVFMTQGKQTENPKLKAVITSIGQKMFQHEEDMTIDHLLLMEIKEYQFIHGAAFIQGRFITVLYFKEIDMGLVAVMGSPEISLARFTSLEVKTDKDIFLVPSTNKTIH